MRAHHLNTVFFLQNRTNLRECPLNFVFDVAHIHYPKFGLRKFLAFNLKTAFKSPQFSFLLPPLCFKFHQFFFVGALYCNGRQNLLALHNFFLQILNFLRNSLFPFDKRSSDCGNPCMLLTKCLLFPSKINFFELPKFTFHTSTRFRFLRLPF